MVTGSREAKPGDMTNTNQNEDNIRVGSIVVAVDGSYHADQAVAWAAEEARLRGLPLAIVYVEHVLGAQERGWLAQAGMPWSDVMEEIRADSEELLHRARAAATTAEPAVDADTVLKTGDAREILPELAARASMIVLELAWSAESHYDGTWSMITEGIFGINRFGGEMVDWASWSNHGNGEVSLVVPLTGSARILPESAGHLGIVLMPATQPALN